MSGHYYHVIAKYAFTIVLFLLAFSSLFGPVIILCKHFILYQIRPSGVRLFTNAYSFDSTSQMNGRNFFSAKLYKYGRLCIPELIINPSSSVTVLPRTATNMATERYQVFTKWPRQFPVSQSTLYKKKLILVWMWKFNVISVNSHGNHIWGCVASNKRNERNNKFDANKFIDVVPTQNQKSFPHHLITKNAIGRVSKTATLTMRTSKLSNSPYHMTT